jgi:hypothetical protein
LRQSSGRTLWLTAAAFVAAVAIGGAGAATAPSGSTTIFSIVGTSVRATFGPCSISASGSTAASVTQGRGTLVAASDPRNGPTCSGPAATIRYDVLGATYAGATTTLAVKVFATDDPSTPVGTTGTITATAGLPDVVTFSIGSHSGGMNVPGFGWIPTRARVAVTTKPNVATVRAFDSAGTSVMASVGNGACTAALAGAALTFADGSSTHLGVGAFQAEEGTPPPPEALLTNTCNGSVGRFTFDIASGVVSANAADAGVLVTDTDDPALLVGAAGSAVAYDALQKLDIAVGAHVAGFGPGAFSLYHGAIAERVGVNVGTRTLGAAAAPAAPPQAAGATVFTAAGTKTLTNAGPCAVDVAGSIAVDGTADGVGSFVASGLPPGSSVASACAGGPTRLRYRVVGAWQTGSTTSLAVEVTSAADLTGTVVPGSIGEIDITDGGAVDTIAVAIGAHTATFTVAPSGPSASWASVTTGYDAAATKVLSTAGAGTRVDPGGHLGSCVAAVAGALITHADGSTAVAGSGNYQALVGPSPFPDETSVCSGGAASFQLTPADILRGGQSAALGFVAGTAVGGATLDVTAQRLVVLKENIIAGFDGGALSAGAFTQMRAAADIDERILPTASGPSGGGTPGRVTGHGELQEILPGTGGAPLASVAIAATEQRPDSGPCTVSLASVTSAAGTTGNGSFVASGIPAGPNATTCWGNAASLRYTVTGVAISAGTVVATVRVTESDDPTTPVGTVGTVTGTDSPLGDVVDVQIGPHLGVINQGPGHSGGFFEQWAHVTIANDPNALKAVAFDGAGTSVDMLGATPNPCASATAGTRVTLSTGATVTRGGGSLQDYGTCNGGGSRFSYLVKGVETNGTTNAAPTLVVDERAAGPALGAQGAAKLEEALPQGDRVSILFANFSGIFGPGHYLYHGYIDERAIANVGSADLSALAAAQPQTGDARKSPRVDLDNVRFDTAGAKDLKGHVKFEDRALGISFKTSTVTSATFSGTTVTVRGFATLDGPGATTAIVSFRVDVDDVGKHSGDTLTIQLSNGYRRSGVLVKGDFDVRTG